MDVAHAIEVIEKVTYKAGWKIVVGRTYGSRRDLDVAITATYVAPDSSRDNAPEYRRTTQVAAQGVIDISDAGSDLDVLRKVLDRLIEIETHEAREFLRYGSELEAPFHPHTSDGNRAWQLTEHGYRAGLPGLPGFPEFPRFDFARLFVQ